MWDEGGGRSTRSRLRDIRARPSGFRRTNTTFTVLDAAGALGSAGKGRVHLSLFTRQHVAQHLRDDVCRVETQKESFHADIFHLLTSTKSTKSLQPSQYIPLLLESRDSN